jgi:phosphatidylethanolamine/phosphatidyl-N-methylethanolamine N-methyltransferase
MRYLTECREFFGQFREQYHDTGSILPSSRFLGRALARPFSQAAGPRVLLEVGPGTGAVTAQVVKLLRPEDRFDIVEINAQFVAVLNRRLAEEPDFQRCRNQIRIIHAPLQEVPGLACYDFLISGLPLNNFAMSLVREVFECYQRLLKPLGVLSYFEYIGIRTLKIPFVSPAERSRLRELGRFLEPLLARYQVGKQSVLRNVPPAVARHLRFGQASS